MNNAYVLTVRSNQRLRVVAWVLCACMVIIIGRLFYVQVARGQDYRARADAQQSRKFQITAKRGEIYLSSGSDRFPLALNESLKLLYADPKFVTNPAQTAAKLAPLTGIDSAVLTSKLSEHNRYVVLQERVEASAADRIKALKLAGIVLADKDYRYYPEGNLFSQVLGYVNADGKGQYGVEGYLDEDLAGQNGQYRAITDSFGVPITDSNNVIVAPKDGKSVVLTLDRTVQNLADTAIATAVKSNKAESGSIIVMDPKTGAIRAMANYPNYDPNNYSKVTDFSLFQNMAVTNLFEPGSGFKAYTMSAGIDAGKVRDNTTYTDTGEVKVAEATIHNAENRTWGVQTMTDVIQKSINTGAVFVLKMLGGDPNKITRTGKESLYNYFTKFGFGVASGVEQAGEASGQVKKPNTSDVDYANMTFGQGISVTEIQMIDAMSAIANGGKLYQPYLVAKTIDGDGNELANQPKLIRDNVVSPQAAATVANMLIKVVEGGSGFQARTPGYKIAGKTGTAQVPKADGSGYEEHKNIGSFVGFAPVDDPKFIILVRVNYPQVPGFAEDTAVPAFAQVARALFKYYQIPPNS